MPLDVHLMIKNPQKFIEAFVKAGANSITVHAEECKNLKKTIGLIRLQGVKAGVSLNPNTPLSKIKHILDDVDIVLIMSVYPGFAGQKFIVDVLPKIKQLRELKPMLNIQVDGGITSETAPLAVAAGANILVAGSAIFKQKNRKKAIAELRESVEYSLPI